ncbi:hypothetical protein OG884_15395 [Streptosporangium sp. NBC_01755]|uniref:hypothetical protein n=1 Tax=unclassified Streptosporangium TaxID=2632669 RepID=UPI002DD831EC|nr:MULTISPECIES: hypothetical protein [unclassified Streptosporangium]WSA27393.1 hypothetical protein OIE13_05835 [Streptosporangium sp. NBC_01810]WSD03218.1 hypothetical protein OG884_15395 [Streptosporangium sp. NBC_01755]
MPSKMTPAQLAAAKGAAKHSSDLGGLATAANGLGVSRADKAKAAAALEQRVGKRQAARLKEEALQRAGAAPKGLRRWFG